MVWHALLHPTGATVLALLPTTADRIVVWGALALVIGLIAWREYTLPDVPPLRPADHETRLSPAPLAAPSPVASTSGSPVVAAPLPRGAVSPFTDTRDSM